MVRESRLIPAHAGKTVFLRSQEGNRRAHPRSRGENDGPRYEGRARRGSSPLTRGKHCGVFDLIPRGRLIPAHAGKTNPSHPEASTKRAHPRSRGENQRRSHAPAQRRGSSPLTRGKRCSRGRCRRLHRLIPAHAGKTKRSPRPTPQTRAHPRSRGENLIGGCLIAPGQGSSPLTRGKRWWLCLEGRLPGLIPAHAGKTLSQPLRALRRTAHPRSRGENSRT